MFHLRFTPNDISGYIFNFLEVYDRYILAQEDKDDNGLPLLHYHILIDTDYGIQSVRNVATASLKIPKSGRGKNNAYYALFADWKDPGYICKYNNILQSKGFSEKEILDYVISGQKKYLNKVKASELSGEVAPAQAPTKREPKVTFQQEVIAYATAEWYKYKRQESDFNKDRLIGFVCDGMRKYGRGINVYLVKDIVYGILYDDLDYRNIILNKIKSQIFL